MEEKVIELVDKHIKEIVDGGELNVGNLDILYKLSKTKHMAKEDMCMYGNYGRGGYGESYGRRGYGEYGEGSYGRDSYGRRGYDMKYRGDDSLDRMAGEYGRYMESRGRYGAGSEETDKSYYYMLEALKDFIKVLHEEAETPQQKMQLKQALQNSMM